MLKQLKLRKQIELKRSELSAIEVKENEILTREAELEKALEEVQNDEDMEVVSGEIEQLDTKKTEVTTEKTKVEKEIEDLEKELEQTEVKGAGNGKEEKTDEDDSVEEERENIRFKNNERRKETMLGKGKMTREKRLEYLEREDVKNFFANLRTVIEKRSIEGLDLTIPNITLDLVRDELGRYSVFYDLVRVIKLNGTARAIIAGEAPEAIWTEMLAKVNELENAFSKVEVDGYKVGGFIPLDNSIIEDSMINLSEFVEEILAESIAIALDKAILYGKGTKMPLGIVTALAADAKLKDSNIVKLTKTETTFAKIIAAFKNIKRGRQGRGPIVVAMNESTWLGTILPMSLATNNNGAFVTAQNGNFPGAGYKVVFNEDIPEDNLIAGDYSKYLLAERKAKKTSVSTDVKFIEDQTLIKTTARYDGKPVRKQAFVLIGLNGVVPTTEVSFMPDLANEEEDAEDGGDTTQGEE